MDAFVKFYLENAAALRRTPDMGLKDWDAEQAMPFPAPTPAVEPARPRHRLVLTWVAEQAVKIAVGVITALIVAGILFMLKG